MSKFTPEEIEQWVSEILDAEDARLLPDGQHLTVRIHVEAVENLAEALGLLTLDWQAA